MAGALPAGKPPVNPNVHAMHARRTHTTVRPTTRPPFGKPHIRCIRLGLTDYGAALAVQRCWHARCVAERANVVLLTQHRPVLTLGYRRPYEQVRPSAARLRAKGLHVVCVERGGGATYHAPGQLVVYPLFSTLLQRYGVRRFVARLETVMQRTCRAFGVRATSRTGYPGAWVGKRKVGAVGVAVRRRVSLHGFALNVDLDLRPFADILPCGLSGDVVTSLERERVENGRCVPRLSFAAVERAAVDALAETFGAHLESSTDTDIPV